MQGFSDMVDYSEGKVLRGPCAALSVLRLGQWVGFPAHPFVACDEL